MADFVIERIRISSEFTTLPMIIWRRFNRPMPGLMEDTLDRNPGLADLPHHLPVGTEFDLKIETKTQAQPETLEAIRLW